jgi:tetratricopeptide (TPR) repeat protein
MPPQSRLRETLLCELKDNNLIYGSRVEVKSLDRLEGEFYNDGFDMFFFKPDTVDNIPKSLSSLGVTWWDYWLPLAAALAGVKLKKLNYPFGYHVSHQTRWSHEQWKFMGLQIATAIYNMRLQAGSNIRNYNELFKLDIMIRGAAYQDLSKKTLNKCEKIYASYFNLEKFSKAVIEFLKSESTNIFFNGVEENANSKESLINKINRKAESELKNTNINVAIRMLLNALKIDPYNPDTLCNLGKAACAKGDLDKSIYYYKICLEKNPYHAVATHNLGKVLLQIGQKRIAEQLYSIHSTRFPGDLVITQALLEF